LSEDQQALLDLQERLGLQYGETAEGMMGRVDETYSEPFDFSGELERDQVTEAMMERMQPFLDEQRQRQQNNLMIQGHNRGGSAWNATQNDLSRRENDARLAAVLAGGDEQSRLFQLEMAKRQLPMAELNALRSGSQPQIPQFQTYRGANVAPAPLFDAKVASAGHQIALGNQALTREQMAMQDALARDQMALQEQIAQQNLGAYGDASRTQGYLDLFGLGLDAYNTFS